VIVVDATVIEAERLYVPVPPVPVPSEMIEVPTVTPVPVIMLPTVREPDVTAVTVRTAAEIEPVTTAAVGPEKYKLPDETVCDADTLYVPTPPTPPVTLISAGVDTVDEADRLYVPTPPDPVPNDVIVVPAVMLVPETT
jgi:hypothetical protein